MISPGDVESLSREGRMVCVCNSTVGLELTM